MASDGYQENGTTAHCFACEREVPEGNWFARVKLGEQRVVFCRPWCVERYLEHEREVANELENILGPLQ